jgi:hypothetical protein
MMPPERCEFWMAVIVSPSQLTAPAEAKNDEYVLAPITDDMALPRDAQFNRAGVNKTWPVTVC